MHSTKLFDYDKATKTFSAEISSLGMWVWCRAYEDACDSGLRLISAKTGHEVMFVVDHIELDDDHDVRWWKLVPTPAMIRKYPQLHNTTMIIWNT